jgi:hypothetical protein
MRVNWPGRFSFDPSTKLGLDVASCLVTRYISIDWLLLDISTEILFFYERDHAKYYVLITLTQLFYQKIWCAKMPLFVQISYIFIKKINYKPYVNYLMMSFQGPHRTGSRGKKKICYSPVSRRTTDTRYSPFLQMKPDIS